MRLIQPLLLAALSGAALLLDPAPALATTAPALTLAQQARKAEVIVRATLGPSSSVTENGVAYVVYPLTIVETIAGDAASLPQFEGRPALYFMQGLSDLPTLTTGQDVIALLYARRLDSPLVGFNQGLYPIVNGQVVPPLAPAPTTNPATTASSTPPAAPLAPASPAAPTSTGASPTSAPAATPTGSPPTGAASTGTTSSSTPPGSTPPSSTAPAATPTVSTPASAATPAATPSPASAFDPSWVDPAKFRAAILAARESK